MTGSAALIYQSRQHLWWKKKNLPLIPPYINIINILSCYFVLANLKALCSKLHAPCPLAQLINLS